MLVAVFGFVLTLSIWQALIVQNSAAAELRTIKDELEDRVVARTSELAAARAEIANAAHLQRAFLRDTFGDFPSDLGKRFGESIHLTNTHGLCGLRDLVRNACEIANMPNDRSYDLVTAAGEAGMNTIVHANHGVAEVYIDDGIVRVLVRDYGAGISVGNLPRATLEKGFTTAGTLGHGIKMMIHTADKTWLLTGTNGTTLLLEQRAHPPEPSRASFSCNGIGASTSEAV